MISFYDIYIYNSRSHLSKLSNFSIQRYSLLMMLTHRNMECNKEEKSVSIKYCESVG